MPTNFCDPSYECQFSAVSKEGVEFDYDLSTLCASGPNGVDYQVRLLLPVGIPAGASTRGRHSGRVLSISYCGRHT